MLIPIRHLSVPDGRVHFSASGDGHHFAICTPSGNCRLFDHDLIQTCEIEVGGGVEWIQLADTGRFILAGRATRIDGYALSGDNSPRFSLPVSGTSFACCAFRDNDEVLCVASWDREPILSAWNLRSSLRIAQAALPSRGGGGYSLISHPEGEAMAAIAFSGQSEEWMFWTHYSHCRLRVCERPEVLDISFPCFHPSGREFVSRHEALGLCRMKFPTAELIGSVQPKDAFPENPEDTFSYNVHFLRDDRFLVAQECLALYEFDLATLRPTQIVLSGADGMTFGKGGFFFGQSWQLAGGRLLTSDRLYDGKLRHRTLRLWDASMLCGPIASPDPARPYTRQLTGQPM